MSTLLDDTRVRRRRQAAVALALWALWYAAYRLYYGFGGEFGMFGRPASAADFRRINLLGGALILLAAVLPPIAVRLWRYRLVRTLVPVLAWIATVGCCAHALVDVTSDLLSLTGVHAIHYPAGLWLSIDRREAALQDLFFNEPWFFIEGVLWGLLAWVTTPSSSRRRWLVVAVAAGALATAVGVLSALGVIPTFRFGAARVADATLSGDSVYAASRSSTASSKAGAASSVASLTCARALPSPRRGTDRRPAGSRPG